MFIKLLVDITLLNFSIRVQETTTEAHTYKEPCVSRYDTVKHKVTQRGHRDLIERPDNGIGGGSCRRDTIQCRKVQKESHKTCHGILSKVIQRMESLVGQKGIDFSSHHGDWQ